MTSTSANSDRSSKPDYNAPHFHGALVSDRWLDDDDPEYSTVSTASIAEVSRAASAIATISRLVHNSLNEPNCSGVEPLGPSAHMALLDGLEIIGRYLGDLGDSMRDTAKMFVESEKEDGSASERHD